MNIILAVAMISAPPWATPVAEGVAQRYAPGRMAETVDNRVRAGIVPPGTDPYMAVTLLDCSMRGREVWVEWPDGIWTGPHMVADCSAAHHLQANLEKGVALEVSYQFAVDHPFPKGRYELPRDGPLQGVAVYEFDWDSTPFRPE